jgi:hypothetical protein
MVQGEHCIVFSTSDAHRGGGLGSFVVRITSVGTVRMRKAWESKVREGMMMGRRKDGDGDGNQTCRSG